MENSAETTVLFLREPIINDNKIADSRFYNEWIKCIETGNVDPS